MLSIPILLEVGGLEQSKLGGIIDREVMFHFDEGDDEPGLVLQTEDLESFLDAEALEPCM